MGSKEEVSLEGWMVGDSAGAGEEEEGVVVWLFLRVKDHEGNFCDLFLL